MSQNEKNAGEQVQEGLSPVEVWALAEKEASVIQDLWKNGRRDDLKKFVVAEWRCKVKGCLVAAILDFGNSKEYLIYREAFSEGLWGDFSDGQILSAYKSTHWLLNHPDYEDQYSSRTGAPDVIVRKGWTCEPLIEGLPSTLPLPNCAHGGLELESKEIRDGLSTYRDLGKPVYVDRPERFGS